MQTYQVNVRHKVTIEGCRDTKGPNAISQRPPDIEVEDLVHRWARAACAGVGRFGGQQGLISETSQHQHKHKEAEDTHGVVQAHSIQQVRQYEGQGDGEEAAAGGHNAVHQAQALLEVVAEDDQAGLVGEGAAAGKYDAIGEVQWAQGPVRRRNNNIHHYTAFYC